MDPSKTRESSAASACKQKVPHQGSIFRAFAGRTVNTFHAEGYFYRDSTFYSVPLLYALESQLKTLSVHIFFF